MITAIVFQHIALLFNGIILALIRFSTFCYLIEKKIYIEVYFRHQNFFQLLSLMTFMVPLRNTKKCQKALRKKNNLKNPRTVLNILIFRRILKVISWRNCPPTASFWRQISRAILEQHRGWSKCFWKQNSKCHTRETRIVLCFSCETFKWRAWWTHLVQCLSQGNMESKLVARTFWLSFEEESFERVILNR